MGIHSGGMVITRDPLIRVAPVEWATMRDRTIIQWDKDDLQELGLIKIDLLGLGMLSLLREAFALHKRCYGTSLALHTIPADDKPTYEMITKADTIGVFQIESRAQQSMLPRMKPACFYDIVMQVAIIRPGPIQGQMVHPFLRRRAGLEPVTYPHPKLKPVLERTMGVPLFQEQGMRMAIEAAGFTPGEADTLRRAMGHKRSHERMREIYPRLVEGMVANGIDRAAAEQLFHMLEGFADYGFPESHAASFALLAYASAYVKCHFPAIFAAAILNVQPMGFYSTEVLVNDARRHDVVVKPVEVNASEYWSHVDAEGALRLGFHLVRGIGERTERAARSGAARRAFCGSARLRATHAARERGDRKPRGRRRVCAVVCVAARGDVGAARARRTRSARRTWEVDGRRRAGGALCRAQCEGGDGVRSLVDRRDDESASGRALPRAARRARVLAAARLAEMPNHLVCRVGGLVITRQRPGTAKGFVFLTIEDETGLVNVIVRPDVYEKYRRVIRTSSMLVIEGVLQKEQGTIDLLARAAWALDDEGVVEGVRAHNFH